MAFFWGERGGGKVKQVGWENQYRFDQEWFAAFSCYFSSLSLMGKVGKEVERQDERKVRKGVARVCSDVSTEEYTPVVKAACQKRTKRSGGQGQLGSAIAVWVAPTE
jgi:hypothetical protein